MKCARPMLRDDLIRDGRPLVASRAGPASRTSRRGTPLTHTHAAISFCTGGKARADQNGEWNLGPGDVLIVPAGAPHRMLEMRRAEFWTLGFCVPCFAAEGASTLLDPV